MVMVAVCSALIGAILGTRFKVLILLPTIAVGIAFVIVVAVLRGSALPTAVGVAVTWGIFLQLGYLGGLVARLATAARPLPSVLTIVPSRTRSSRAIDN
jgi:hypothetical protein